MLAYFTHNWRELMLIKFTKRIAAIFAERFDNSPLTTAERVAHFTGTRAAYVAQTSLYGYLKTRMGTSFQRHFEDETFGGAIKDSAVRLGVSCIGDLTVFAVATARAGGGALDDDASAALARHIFSQALPATVAANDLTRLAADAQARFAARVDCTHWPNAAIGEAAFAGSAGDLIRYAPVIDEFKALDERIVTNSIRFRWRDVRERLRKRIDGPALAADWQSVLTAETKNPLTSKGKPGG